MKSWRFNSLARTVLSALVVVLSGMASAPLLAAQNIQNFLRARMPADQSAAKETLAFAQFQNVIRPILETHCYDCHGDGESKGGMAFDKLTTKDQALRNPKFWHKVLKNTRSHIMPPQNHPPPTPEEQQSLEQWIKYDAFDLDPNQPDPGRVTIRRLNRQPDGISQFHPGPPGN